MDSDRSASTVGDLLELHAGRTGMGFWIDATRVGFVHLAFSLTQDPIRSLRVAAAAFGLAVIAEMSAGCCLVVWQAFSPEEAHAIFGILWVKAFSIIILTCSYSIGRWIFQRSRGREVQIALVTYLLVCFLFDHVMVTIGRSAESLADGHRSNAIFAVISQIPFDLRSQLGFLVAGVVSRILYLRSAVRLTTHT